MENKQLQEFQTFFADMTRKYYSSPVEFTKDVFKATPTMQQEEVLRSLAKDKKVSVRAGHGVGKSTLASWAVYWFLITRPYPKIICTAPTFHQLYDVLWSEMAKWRRQSDLITNSFDWTQRRIEAKWAPKEWFAAARTADKAEGLQGRHAEHFLLVVDEASGIDDSIFEAAEGMLTGVNSYVLMLSNPTKNSGYFFKSHNKDRAIWGTHKLSCLESPIVSKEYVERVKTSYGLDSNVYRVRVLGEFPLSEEDVLIPFDWVSDSVGREMLVGENEPTVLGVDVGAGGDRSVILHRNGGKVTKIVTSNSKNTMDLIGLIGQEAKDSKADAIFIDPIGIGKGAYDRLSELGFKVYPVDVRMKARKSGFMKLRDELWWNLRTHFEKGLISLPENDDLVSELTTIKYKPDSSGKIKVEGKGDMRGRGLASPDIADALMMTYYINDAMFAKDTSGKYGVNKPTAPGIKSTAENWMVA